MLIGIGCGVVFLFILIIIFKVSSNKFVFVEAKVDEAIKNIEMYLDKKFDILNKLDGILKKKKINCDFFDNFDKNTKKANYFELKEDLDNIYSRLLMSVEEKEEDFNKKEIISILDNLKQIQIELTASINYYNDKVSIYNHLVKGFPSGIVAFFKHYKVRDTFDSDVKENFNILNED